MKRETTQSTAQVPGRSLDLIVRQILEAMDVLSQASCGAIGPDGATMEEMEEAWEAGGTYGDDAYYDTCQHVWRLLEMAVAMSNDKAHWRGWSAAESSSSAAPCSTIFSISSKVMPCFINIGCSGGVPDAV